MVFDEIRRDLRRPAAMTRLLQGDVGSGKALIALLTALLVGETKAQVCFIGPDDIAAEHRYLFAEPLLRAAGLVPQLVSGKPSMAQADAIRRGEAHAVFASHALFENFPEFKKLGLVIVEERAQFGVTDRKAICQKGVNPDLLVVTSVPIPLSLTFTVFSKHDLSVLREPMRQSVVTKVRGPTEREAAYATLREQLELGRQAYVVFPTLLGKDLLELAQARQLVSALNTEAFPGAKVALYHGGMGREELPDFQLADPTRDRPLLLKARRAALDLLKDDPQLRQRHHRGLVRLLRERGREMEGEPRPEANRGGAKAKGRRRRRRRKK